MGRRYAREGTSNCKVPRTWRPAPSNAQLTEPISRIPAEELALQADGVREFIIIFSVRRGKW
jgi:hypothetical protein